jgi:carbonic anhydrase
MEIKIAPKNADQKPVIFMDSVNRSVIKSIAVLTTSNEIPKDKKASGKVRIFSNVPKVALIKARISAITK